MSIHTHLSTAETKELHTQQIFRVGHCDMINVSPSCFRACVFLLLFFSVSLTLTSTIISAEIHKTHSRMSPRHIKALRTDIKSGLSQWWPCCSRSACRNEMFNVALCSDLDLKPILTSVNKSKHVGSFLSINKICCF